MSKNKDTNLGRIRTRYHFHLDKLYKMTELLEQHVAEDGFERRQDNNFVRAVEAWIQEVPTRCYGPELKGNCGNPQLPEETCGKIAVFKGNKHVTSLCWECRQERWEENPPLLSKAEQKTIAQMEANWKELLLCYKQGKGHEGLRSFKRNMAPLRKRMTNKDYLSFHADVLDNRYRKELEALQEVAENGT